MCNQNVRSLSESVPSSIHTPLWLDHSGFPAVAIRGESIARATVSLLLYTSCALIHLQCAMCYVLCTICYVKKRIYCAGAASEIDFAIIFNGVITTSGNINWMLSSKWTLSKNEIFQWWLLLFCFSFEVDAINLNQLFVLDCSYHNLERGKQQMLKGIFWWILVLTSAKINGSQRERNCVRVPDPRPV